ncbi:MAG: thrombospondin type 3 repeat-containing protein [bacterium]
MASGDPCDPDVDGDGHPNEADTCPRLANLIRPTLTATGEARLRGGLRRRWGGRRRRRPRVPNSEQRRIRTATAGAWPVIPRRRMASTTPPRTAPPRPTLTRRIRTPDGSATPA